jgi:hypothetical protein
MKSAKKSMIKKLNKFMLKSAKIKNPQEKESKKKFLPTFPPEKVKKYKNKIQSVKNS